MLVLYDYPEAFSLRNVITSSVAEELIEYFKAWDPAGDMQILGRQLCTGNIHDSVYTADWNFGNK